MPSAKPGPSPRANASVQRIIEEVKRMIINSELLPGQQIRQEKLAEALNVSRLPVREALHQLIAAGLVVHEHNVGFAVTRLSNAEFEQIYTLRELMEVVVIRSLPAPTRAQMAEVRKLHRAVERSAKSGQILEMKLLNRDFHFAIFGMSPLDLMIRELDRVWTWALPYHEVYLHSEEGRKRVIAEHAQMVTAVADNDHEELIRLMRLHRAGASQQMNLLLEHPPTRVVG